MNTSRANRDPTVERFLLFANPLPEPMLLVSASGRVLASNASTKDRIGIAPETLIERQLADVVADSEDHVHRYLRRCSRSRQMVLGSLTLIGQSGRRIACRAEGALTRPKSEKAEALVLLRLLPKESAIGRFVALNQRIAELDREILRRRRAEESTRQQQERLRVTLHSIGDAVITTDVEGRVLSLNTVAETLTGWTEEEAAGRPLASVFRIVDERTRLAVESPVTRVLREGVVVGLANHTLLVTKDGRELPIDDSAAPIRSAEGRTEGCVLVFRDATERRRSESALRDADRRKDEFLATLSHELRNPLAPIGNALQILKRAEDDPLLLRRATAVIERQWSHMVRLVDDLLDVSRITRDQLELRKARIELASVIHQAVETWRPLAAREEKSIEVDTSDPSIYLDADPVRLAQVFSNLVHNACKYTSPGGTIQVTVERADGEVRVSVIDDGIGLPEDRLENIFDMFEQVDSTMERTRGGLGIGLTLARRLVELHGGTIDAQNLGPDVGSKFVVRLPIAESDRPAPPSKVEEPSTTPRRMLIVDDNEDNAASLATVLELAGHTTETAHDGLQAIETADRFRPEVILLDIGLPELNGYDVCRRIRKRDWGRKIAIVAVTGWGQEQDRQKSKDAGFDTHFVKPVDHAVLNEFLDSLAR